MAEAKTCLYIEGYQKALIQTLTAFLTELFGAPTENKPITPDMKSFFKSPIEFKNYAIIQNIHTNTIGPNEDFGSLKIAFATDAIRQASPPAGNDLIYCYDTYVNVLLPVAICLKILKKETFAGDIDTLQIQKALYESIKEQETSGLKSKLIGATSKAASNNPIQMDINKLLVSGTTAVGEIRNVTFSKESLDALNSSTFNDYFGNNKYFEIKYTRDGSGTIEVKKDIYGLRQYKDIAALLQATLAKNQEIIHLEYPTTGEPVDPALVALLADMNSNFAYIQPRLNVNLKSLFSSPKASAIQNVLNPVKELHAVEGKHDTSPKYKIEHTLRPLETLIKVAREDNEKLNNKKTTNVLFQAKKEYKDKVNELIKDAQFETHRKEYRKERDRVLGEWDLFKRMTHFVRRREGGKRTRRLRQRK